MTSDPRPSVDAVAWAVHRTIEMHRADEWGQAGHCAYCQRGQQEECPAVAKARQWLRTQYAPARHGGGGY